VDALRKRTAAGWVACAVLLAGAWGVWRHRLDVIDLDDAASNEVLFARQPLANVLFDLPWTDQSPLSFVLLHFWRLAGEDPATIRLLNVALLTASLLLLHAVGRRLCSPGAALGAVTLAVVSPASLWVARSGRMYSLQLLLWMVSLLFMVRYAEESRPRHLAGFVIASVLAIYNHFVGFVSTATALLWLVTEAVARSRAGAPQDRAETRRRLLGPPVAAGLAILVLVQPQMMRLLALLQAPPAVVAGQAVPGGWLPFLDAVSSFWLMNADWGPARGYATVLRSLLLASAYGLFVLGLARGSARLVRLVVVTVLVPLALIGVAAGGLDFRDRHLLYLLPLVWLVITNGALGGDSVEGLRPPAAVLHAAAALLVVVGGASAWLLYRKLPERHAEWSKVVTGLAQIRRPGLAVYMLPGPLVGTPMLIASRLDPSGALGVRPLAEETRLDFLAEAAEGRDVAILTSVWSPPSGEHAWRARYLEGRGYRRLALPSAGATAELFWRGEPPRFSTEGKLGARPSASEAVAWARRRAHEPSRPRRPGRLGRALVARVEADGTARESTFFASQHGESGSWRLGADDGDVVEETRLPVGSAEREMLIARPTGESLLVVVLPGTDVARPLRLTCGGGAGGPAAGIVSVEVFIDDHAAARSTCPLGEWRDLATDTGGSRGPTADVTVALSAVGVDRAEIAFGLGTGEGTVAPEIRATDSTRRPVQLTTGHTLKDALDRLEVYRTQTAGFGRAPARFETASRSAAIMHESAPAGEGGLEARWQLGPLPWDAVGLTRQRSGGEARSGLWAHPKAGTTLVIETDETGRGRALEGFHGLTDFSVEQAKAFPRAGPVRFRVYVDGRPVLAREVPRARGWTSFAADLPEAPSPSRRLRVEIDAPTDSWAHFVFDLWTR
jgi:hypothetical protein